MFPAKSWSGSGHLVLSAASQGISRTYETAAEFKNALEEIQAAIKNMERDLLSDDSTPEFLKAWLVWQWEQLEHCRLTLQDRKYTEAATGFQDLLESGSLFHLETPAGQFELRDRGARDIPLQMLAAYMFFEVPEVAKTSLGDRKHSPKADIFVWCPELKDGGESRVLYELLLNSGRALTELTQRTRELERLKGELEQALINARKTLQLKPAANRWKDSAQLSSFLAFVGLMPFLLLLIGVPLALVWNWADVSATVSAVFYAEDEKTRAAIALWTKFFTDAPWATFVFVTVPVLLFAWTLKHFSRIFVQNMNLATDAGRRAALADVYTRIVSDPELNADGNAITDEQKKIIFEAMFRPRDPRHTDDGIDHTSLDKVIDKMKGKG